ncbi:MAG: isoprenylcysteine carboxylmethyltransferase family protein [Rhodospirillales bacterium]|nr:isoprenylcysteine carboxylmethyltransferase family protein [Rhodospirillales bacterium]
MLWRHLKSILILPGNALVVVPGLILWFTRETTYGFTPALYGQAQFWAAAFFAAVGLNLMAATIRLFVRQGQGTLAPWDPTQKLVIEGPYRYVRNPMISGVLCVLAAESLFFQSWPVAGWLAVFFLLNNIYFPLHEEKGLEARFGDDYRLYKKNVPRWVPRLRPWSPED